MGNKVRTIPSLSGHSPSWHFTEKKRVRTHCLIVPVTTSRLKSTFNLNPSETRGVNLNLKLERFRLFSSRLTCYKIMFRSEHFMCERKIKAYTLEKSH